MGGHHGRSEGLGYAGDREAETPMSDAGESGPETVVARGTGRHESASRAREASFNRILVGAVLGVLALAVGALTVLLLTVQSESARASERLAEAEARIAEYEAADLRRRDEDAARPDLLAIAERYFAATGVDVDGDAESVGITIRTATASTVGSALRSMLEELGFSSAVVSRMGNTRALDGTQRAEGDGVNVTWSYHPDDGLSLVFEAERR